jgi:hypothetical protein
VCDGDVGMQAVLVGWEDGKMGARQAEARGVGGSRRGGLAAWRLAAWRLRRRRGGE